MENEQTQNSKKSIMWGSILNILIGLFLIIVPGPAHLSQMAADTNHILGPLVVAFGVISIWQCNRNARLVNILWGLCLILAVFIFGFNGYSFVIDLIGGVLIILFSFIKGKVDHNFGGGWSALFK